MNVADRSGVAQRLHAAIVAEADVPIGAPREDCRPVPKGAPLLRCACPLGVRGNTGTPRSSATSSEKSLPAAARPISSGFCSTAQSAWADVTSSATRPTSSGPFVRSRPARIPSRECRRGGSTASARFRVGAPRPRPGTTRALFSREAMEEPNSEKGSLCECRRGRAPRMYWRLVARQPVAPNGKPFAGLATFAAKHHRIREQLRRNRRPSPRDQRMPQSSFGRPTVLDLAPNSSIISSTP